MTKAVNETYIINSKASGPHVMIIAGVHGDEFEPILAADTIASRLSGLLIAGSVTVVPVVNQNAYLMGSRCGADQLDLARICPGKEDGTVSEKAAFRISTLIRDADYLVDMHTGGVVHDIFPMAGYMLHPNIEVLEKQKRMAAVFNMPVIWGTDPLPNGRTLSVARDANIPAIYLEYGGGSGFRMAVVEKYVDGVLNLLRDLKMIAGDACVQPANECYWVEDFRNDSGSFQSKMPSPSSGIFVAEKQPGSIVHQGECFGSITNPQTGSKEEVIIPFDGITLAVRVAVGVKQGDALGVILPLTKPGFAIIENDGKPVQQ